MLRSTVFARNLHHFLVKMQTSFDSSEHGCYAKSGENGITDKPSVTQQARRVASPGVPVAESLMPATSYFREMFWYIVVAGSEPRPPDTPYPGLKNMIRRTLCDAEAIFRFRKYQMARVYMHGGSERQVRRGVDNRTLLDGVTVHLCF